MIANQNHPQLILRHWVMIYAFCKQIWKPGALKPQTQIKNHQPKRIPKAERAKRYCERVLVLTWKIVSSFRHSVSKGRRRMRKEEGNRQSQFLAPSALPGLPFIFWSCHVHRHLSWFLLKVLTPTPRSLTFSIHCPALPRPASFKCTIIFLSPNFTSTPIQNKPKPSSQRVPFSTNLIMPSTIFSDMLAMILLIPCKSINFSPAHSYRFNHSSSSLS